jgi:type II secretory pathway component HofQ
LPAPYPLPAGKSVDLSFNQLGETEVFRAIGSACGLNIVVPDAVRFNTTVELKSVPCDQALEVLLESRSLWYRYSATGNLLRIAPRRQLDMEMHAAVERNRVRAELGIKDDVLPDGEAIDLELKNAPIAEVLKVLGNAGGVNVVMSDAVGGSVTVIAKSVRWRDALRVVLESQSLGYRYRENGKLLMVAPQREIDIEDHAAVERRRVTAP